MSDTKHWDMILVHCGGYSRIRAGLLRNWIWAVVNKPEVRLPYLFFYGPEASGKSIFHEAISILIPDKIVNIAGYLDANSRSRFKNQIFLNKPSVAVIDGIKTTKTISVKIDSMMACDCFLIDRPGQDSVTIDNNLHFIHCAQDYSERPTLDNVDDFHCAEIKNPIPKKVLLEHLRVEAPAFMETLK